MKKQPLFNKAWHRSLRLISVSRQTSKTYHIPSLHSLHTSFPWRPNPPMNPTDLFEEWQRRSTAAATSYHPEYNDLREAKVLAKLIMLYEEMRGGYATADATVSLQKIASQLEYDDMEAVTPEDMAMEIFCCYWFNGHKKLRRKSLCLSVKYKYDSERIYMDGVRAKRKINSNPQAWDVELEEEHSHSLSQHSS